MADGNEDRYGYSNLTHSGIAKINSKDDKNVSLSVDVFNGTTSISVWSGGGGKPWSVKVPRKTMNTFRKLFEKLRKEPGVCRFPIGLNEWDQDNKRMKQIGQIGFGIDETMTPYIDVKAQALNGGFMFPIKQDGRFDFSGTPLTERDHIEAAFGWLEELFGPLTIQAERMSSFKRPRGDFGGGGGNRGGNNNRGGGGGGWQNNQGGGNRQQQSSTFGGDDDLQI